MATCLAVPGPADRRPPAATAGRRGRSVWGILDQGLSSVTNLAVAVFVGRAVDPAEFGRFTGAVLAYQVASGLLRGAASESLTVRASGMTADESRPDVQGSLALSMVGGALVAVALVVVAFVGDGSFRAMTLILAASLPLLALQDAVRYAALTLGRPKVAVVSDAAWLVVLLAAGMWLASGEGDTATPYFTAWAVAGALSGPVGLALLRVGPRPGRVREYWHRHRPLILAYGTEAVAQRGAPRLSVASVGFFASVSAFAGLRGAILFGSQMSVLIQAVRLVTVPEAVRAGQPRERMRVAMGATAALVATLTIGAVVLMSLPDEVGRQLLGDTWALARPLLVWVLLRQILEAVTVGAEIGLRALERPRESLRARSIGTVLLVAAGVGGAALDGANGAAAAMAGGQAVAALVWFGYMRSSYRSALVPSEPAPRAQPE